MVPEQTILEKYHTLSSFEKELLQVLSVVYEPANTTLLVGCLRKLEIKNPRGNQPTAANLNHYFAKFEQLGLMTAERQCVPEIVETLSKQAVAANTFDTYAKVIREEAPVSYYYGKWSTRCWRAIREMRIGIYTQDFELIESAEDFLKNQCKEVTGPTPPIVQVTTRPFDLDWIRSLPVSFQFYLLSTVLQYSSAQLESCDEILDYLQHDETLNQLSDDELLPFKRLIFNQLLMQGELDRARELVNENSDSFHGTGALGTLNFLQGRRDEARAAYDQDLGFLSQLAGSSRVAFFGPTGLFYILFLLQDDDESVYPAIGDRIGLALTLFENARENQAYNFLGQVVTAAIDKTYTNTDINFGADSRPDALTLAFGALSQYWLNSSIDADVEEMLLDNYSKAESGNYLLFKAIFAELLGKIYHDSVQYQDAIEEARNTQQLTSLITIMEPDEPWKRSLEALIQATATSESGDESQQLRLVWMLNAKRHDISISPREQKRLTGGGWSKGRPVSLSRLYQSSKLTHLSAQDRKICAAIKKLHNSETQSTNYQFDMEKALNSMVGHPLLFLADSPSTPVELITGEPEILVEERGEQLHIRFAQPISSENITIYRETPTRIKLINITDNHRRIAQITGKDGLTVPKEASDDVLTAIGNISSFMTVHSAIATDHLTGKNGDITVVEADPTIYMHLRSRCNG